MFTQVQHEAHNGQNTQRSGVIKFLNYIVWIHKILGYLLSFTAFLPGRETDIILDTLTHTSEKQCILNTSK